MQETQLTFVAEGDAKLPSILIGDQIRLKQVLVNLTKNALKFTYKKPITLKASYDTRSELLQVKVVDAGRGINAVDMK